MGMGVARFPVSGVNASIELPEAIAEPSVAKILREKGS